LRLLDTNIVGKLLRGDPKVISRLANAEGKVFVNGIVVQEIIVGGYEAEIHKIMTGASKSDLGTMYGYMLDAVKKLAAFDLLPYTTEAENKYKALKKLLGHRLKKSDGRIAAHAVQLGFILVTQNTKDFEEIPGLTLENWAD
jgi:tRNA(fMet)-specific endonuclease VapC